MLCRYDWVVWLVLVMGLGYIHCIYSRVSCRYDNNYNYDFIIHIFISFLQSCRYDWVVIEKYLD